MPYTLHNKIFSYSFPHLFFFLLFLLKDSQSALSDEETDKSISERVFRVKVDVGRNILSTEIELPEDDRNPCCFPIVPIAWTME